MRRLGELKTRVNQWNELCATSNDLREMAEMAAGEDDFLDEIAAERDALMERVDDLELQLALSGPYDDNNAILIVHSGEGGVDAQDFAEMLSRMYLRWADRNELKAELLDTTEGEEAGVKNATIEFRGAHAYGLLKGEGGPHRLVRLSPFDSAHRRHTAFALVEVIPEIESDSEVDLRPDDVRVDTFRSSGAGGQHVNKTDSAVRLTHLPTGIVVSCQNERSQHQNKAVALQILAAKLVDRQRAERQAELEALTGPQSDNAWGNQIRSYVLAPYQLVKDLRTSHETGNVQAVLDGDLDGFMEAFLRWRRTETADGGA